MAIKIGDSVCYTAHSLDDNFDTHFVDGMPSENLEERPFYLTTWCGEKINGQTPIRLGFVADSSTQVAMQDLEQRGHKSYLNLYSGIRCNKCQEIYRTLH